MSSGAVSAEVVGGFALGSYHAQHVYRALPHLGSHVMIAKHIHRAREEGILEPEPDPALSKGHKSAYRLSEAFYVKVLESFLTDASEVEKRRYAALPEFRLLVRHVFGSIALDGRVLPYRPSVDEVISVLAGIAQFEIEETKGRKSVFSNLLRESVDRRAVSVVTIVQRSLVETRIIMDNEDGITELEEALYQMREDFELGVQHYYRGHNHESSGAIRTNP